MKINKQIQKVIIFLKTNGWKENNEYGNDYISFFHENNYGIDIEKNSGEIIIIGNIGDIFHITLSRNSLYALVGYLIMHPCIYSRYNFDEVNKYKEII